MFVLQVNKGGCAVLKVSNPDRFIYYLVTKEKTGSGYYPTYDSLKNSLTVMRDHMLANNIKHVAVSIEINHFIKIQ